MSFKDLGEMRLLIIASHNHTDLKSLRRLIQKLIDNIPGIYRKVIRIDRIHMELDLTIDADLDESILKHIRRELDRLGVNISEVREVDGVRIGEWKEALAKLVARGRYWEAHELLEDIWRETGEDKYKYIILFLIPFIKAQMDQWDKISKAVERFMGIPEIMDVDIDFKCLKRIILEKDPNNIEDWLYPPNIKRCFKKFVKA